jgi:non-specific serine/threonine protein kinase
VRGQTFRSVYKYGEWEVDLARRELRSRGVPIPIGGRAFEIIETLVQAAGELVSKDELMARVWPGIVVEKNTLTVHVSAARKALGLDRRMLETAIGRGYRLLGNWALQSSWAPPAPAEHHPTEELFGPIHTNLPISGSDLIGRGVATRQLRDLLSAYRVVTLTGAAGIGKTSLALEVARRVHPTFDGDCLLVELVSLSEPGLVPSAVARVLNLKLGGEEISAESIARAIGRRKTLLILDNCEHVIDAAAILADTLLRMCPQVTILATSREALSIAGEYTYRVPVARQSG